MKLNEYIANLPTLIKDAMVVKLTVSLHMSYPDAERMFNSTDMGKSLKSGDISMVEVDKPVDHGLKRWGHLQINYELLWNQLCDELGYDEKKYKIEPDLDPIKYSDEYLAKCNK